MPSITPTPDLVEAVVNLMNHNGTFTSYVDNGDGTFTGATCDTLHARPNCPIVIDGSDYLVRSVVNGQSITFDSTGLPPSYEFTVDTPYFFHGTPQAVQIELSNIEADSDKYPMIYLLEIINDTNFHDKTNRLDRESDLLMFFLDGAKAEDLETDDHYTQVVNPMRNLCQAFITAAQKTGAVGKLETSNTIGHAHFGIYLENKGHESNIFSDVLSGVELRINLPFTRQFVCNC